MKVMHTESSLGWGGQENRTLNECLGLKARGHDVLVVAPPSARLLERAAQAGLRTAAIPMRSGFDLPAVWALLRLLRRERPDIVSSHSGRDTTLAGLATRLLRHRPRLVRTRHLILPITSRFNYDGLPDHVVTVSKAVREELIAAGIAPDHLTAVPTGIFFARFDWAGVEPVLRRELGLPADTVLVGTIAILRRGKGHHHLLEAAAKVLTQTSQVHFVLAGDGPQSENLKRQARELGIADHVSFLGLRRDVPAVLASLDIFVLPTRREALGTSFIEAQAMGVPVIGSRVGGVPETMIEGETGLLVPAEDPPALAEAILALVRDPARRRAMGQGGAAFVRERYSVDTMVDGMIAVYRQQMEGH
jgi:glycosyltransferase involved in cell wall biosynthesis